MPVADDIDALARVLPKVLLHDHLDGGLRPATLLELLRERGVEPPAGDAAALAAWFDQRAHAGSLDDYLLGFALTVGAMASLPALQRVAFEAAEDVRADGCVLAEFRIAPTLFEAHGLQVEAAIEAMLQGLQRSALPSGLILCAMRERSGDEAQRVAQLARRYLGHGVVGFDLAGAELGHPPSEHAAAIAIARDGGVPLTLHAGEADGAPRVIEAARLGAQRIGHGVRLADALGTREGAALIDEARERGVHLELCPTSNVHTGAAASIANHPITALHRANLSVSFHTDNRLMSRVTPAQEAAALLRDTPLTLADLAAMGVRAARHAFVADAARSRAEAAIRAFAADRGLSLAE
ncbi:MAG TPA: adenosine deaminase family protein [Burkholderiaceae bacterium]|nr:adenosine deaminase family protein [Burkholderiaceae bacterium]